MIKNRLTIGILAHVDAGKTTLSEALLYKTGAIKSPGRVDHQSAHLDTDDQEKARGITIFSGQAQLQLPDTETEITLLDTPGHVDFGAEMERTLPVLDLAILVVSGRDGVQAHTATLWKLLEDYKIPVFIFVNKMDMEGTASGRIMAELAARLSEGCFSVENLNRQRVDSDSGVTSLPENLLEELAMCDEELMEEYLASDTISQHSLAKAIASRIIFPCYFGSALKMTGVDELIDAVGNYAHLTGEKGKRKTDAQAGNRTRTTDAQAGSRSVSASEMFTARVFKITYSDSGERLTHLKVLSGSLHPRDEIGDEKVSQTRMYSGASYNKLDEALSGMVCTALGLTNTYAGQVIVTNEGCNLHENSSTATSINSSTAEITKAKNGPHRSKGSGMHTTATADRHDNLEIAPQLNAVMTYSVELPEGTNMQDALVKLRRLGEEDPQLCVTWDERSRKIHMKIMGPVQMEILKETIRTRYNLAVEFGEGTISYWETIAVPIEGAGHFEPLRHYAEVHLLMEPLQRGSGLVFDSALSEDILSRNWQRLIMTHMAEKEHIGTLTGSPITDMKIIITAGKAHDKHTEGGDFRQATYRAIRQALRKSKENGEIILLEPWYEFTLEIPAGMVGRAMSDIQRMGGSATQNFDTANNSSATQNFDTANNSSATQNIDTANNSNAAQNIDTMPKVSAAQNSGAARESLVLLEGRAPVSEMKDYGPQVASYTKGYGNLNVRFGGYDVCHDTDAVVEKIGYDPDSDVENPADSVFCSHGAGHSVPWYESDEMMHVAGGLTDRSERNESDEMMHASGKLARHTGISNETTENGAENARLVATAGKQPHAKVDRAGGFANAGLGHSELSSEEDAELQRIFRNTYGNGSNDSDKKHKSIEAREFDSELERRRKEAERRRRAREKADRDAGTGTIEYLLVDGYNIIFAWDELKELAKANLDGAREALIEILCNYRGFMQNQVIVVFDAYKVKGGQRRFYQHDGITVVYTAEAETADTYIERTTYELSGKGNDRSNRTGKGSNRSNRTGKGNDRSNRTGKGSHRLNGSGIGSDSSNGLCTAASDSHNRHDSNAGKARSTTHKRRIRVATSDRLEQMIITGNNASKISAKDFRTEVEAVETEISELIKKHNRKNTIENPNKLQIPKTNRLW